MQSPDLQRVSRGLALVHWGVRLIAGAVVTAAALFVVITLVSFGSGAGGLGSVIALALLMFLISFPIGTGILLGAIGRVLCLRTPPELPIARARIRLAVILEGCGLLTAVVTGVVAAVANGAGPIRLAYEVLYSVLVFAVVLFAAGQAFFYAFSVALAKAVDMKPATRPSLRRLRAAVKEYNTLPPESVVE